MATCSPSPGRRATPPAVSANASEPPAKSGGTIRSPEKSGSSDSVSRDRGHPGSDATSGLVAYLDGEPVGWCAVDRRSAYVRLGQTPWKGRSEDEGDDSVWAITCFAVRVGYRGRGITYRLAEAEVDFARERGARALEGYPMIPDPGKNISWGEIHVGHRKVFEAAGFDEISHPSKRRCVMRIDF